MRFEFTAGELDWREEIRSFIRNEADPSWMNKWTTTYERSGSPDGLAWRQALGRRGWLGVGWPSEYGGLGKSFVEQWILLDEASRVGLPKLGIGVNMVAPTMMRVASTEMKAEWLPRIASGEVEFALGYSEPDAGTDLASLRTSAVLDGDEWVINGQKVWNSGGHVATHEWLAVRTDTNAPKHAGISLLLIPIDHPGVTVRPIWTWGDLRTNELFLDNVRVPRTNLVGEVNKGWDYLVDALDSERLVMGETGDLQRVFFQLVHHVRVTTRKGRLLSHDPLVRDWLARMETDIQVTRLLSLRIARLMDQGASVVAEGSIVKLWITELRTRMADGAMQLLGLHGQLRPGDAYAPLDGFFEHHFRDAVHLTFAGGASEIQRDIVARRGLGLPRAGRVANSSRPISGIESLDLDDVQSELVEIVRRFRARHCPSSRMRTILDSDTGHDSDLWRSLVEMGWVGLTLPEKFGGGGARQSDLAVVAEELGRALIPKTFHSTTAAAEVVRVGGTAAVQEDLLGRVCAGDLLLALAHVEGDETEDIASLQVKARYDRGGWRLSGTKMFVADAASADLFLVTAQLDDPLADAGPAFGILMVDPGTSGVTVSPLDVTGRDKQAIVTFEDVVVEGDNLLARDGVAADAISAARHMGQVLQMVDALGIGQEVLQMTVDYVKQRVVFGSLLGTFQAVQHRCADALIGLEAARQLVYEAVWRLSEGLPADKELARAEGFAPEAVKRVCLTAHQLLGGIGYSTEHDLYLFTNRALTAELTSGTPSDHRTILADVIGI